MKKVIVLLTILALLAPVTATAQKKVTKKTTTTATAKEKKSSQAKTEESDKANDSKTANADDQESLDFYDRDLGPAKKTSSEKDTLLRANTDTLMKHVRTLSSSQYEGRMAGSQAYLDAAAYCAEVLASYGVQPFEGEWNHYFEVEYNEIENCTFNTYVNDNDTRIRYVLGRDFVCGSMTGRGYIAAPVVFCGYGIDALAFNEYASVDVQGKIVLCLSGTPGFLPNRVAQKYATLRDKALAARRHGAVGLVCINMSESCRSNEVQLQAYSGTGEYLPTFPMVQPTREMGEALLRDEQMTLDSVLGVFQAAQRPQSFHLRKHFEININAKYRPNAPTCNVIGVLPGYDSKMKRECIVVGAHLDHVGVQGKTCIFPGADDNASGVAAVLEAARLLTTNAPESIEYNKRTIIFVLFSGGEIQHIGAHQFLKNYPKLKNVECFINAECIGAGDSINVLGNKQFPLLWEIASHNDSISTKSMIRSQHTLPNKGDAACFAQMNIPTLIFTHFQGNHYAHVPSDISENIERTIFTKNASLMAEVIYELSLGDYQGRSGRSKRLKYEE